MPGQLLVRRREFLASSPTRCKLTQAIRETAEAAKFDAIFKACLDTAATRDPDPNQGAGYSRVVIGFGVERHAGER